MSVLEPSAGKGDIADAVRDAGATVEMLEIVPALQDILKAKGHKVVGEDFLKHGGRYDRILMNPPFENGQDIDHVRHAFSLLEPRGRVVAIMSEGSFSRGDKKATTFRDWLDEQGGTSEKLDAGSFTNAPDGFSTPELSRVLGVWGRSTPLALGGRGAGPSTVPGRSE